MKSTKDQVLIQHILDASEAIFGFVSDLTFSEFTESDLVVSAVMKKFEIIGEASNRLSADFHSAHSEIPW